MPDALLCIERMRKTVATRMLKGIHRSARVALGKAGFRFEVRQSGDFKLGLWRRTFRNARSPRRFVLIPGFGDTPLSWLLIVLLLMPVLRKRYDEIVLMDFPGFQGMLCDERACESMDLLMSSVQDLLHSLKPETVLGHSLGGWLAASYAVRCGRESKPWLQDAILVCPSGINGDGEERRRWRERFRRGIEEGFHHLREALFAKEPLWFRWVARDFSGFLSRPDIVSFLGSVEERHEVREGLAEVRCRVWLAWGEHDRLVPSSWHRAWLEALGPVGEHRPIAVLVEDAGHSPQLERPRVLARAIASFLRGEALGRPLGTESRRRLGGIRVVQTLTVSGNPVA